MLIFGASVQLNIVYNRVRFPAASARGFRIGGGFHEAIGFTTVSTILPGVDATVRRSACYSAAYRGANQRNRAGPAKCGHTGASLELKDVAANEIRTATTQSGGICEKACKRMASTSNIDQGYRVAGPAALFLIRPFSAASNCRGDFRYGAGSDGRCDPGNPGEFARHNNRPHPGNEGDGEWNVFVSGPGERRI